MTEKPLSIHCLCNENVPVPVAFKRMKDKIKHIFLNKYPWNCVSFVPRVFDSFTQIT